MSSSHLVATSKFGFVITKPLQLLVVLAIIEQLPATAARDLLILDAFADAAEIAAAVEKYRAKWGDVHFFSSHDSMFQHCLATRYATLFMDSDVGFKKNVELLRIRLRSPACRFAVYEEGVGTYRTDLYRGWRKQLLRTLGAGVHFGGNRLVSEVYVFDKAEYAHAFGESKVIAITCNLMALLEKYAAELFGIFGADRVRNALGNNGRSKEAVLYLSSWQVDSAALLQIRAEQCLKILKPHPHHRNITEGGAYEGFFVAPAGMPAEILLLLIGEMFDTIRIYHHGTSAERYVKKPNLKYVLLNPIVLTRF